VSTNPPHWHALGLIAAVVATGCDGGGYALGVGSDQMPEGGGTTEVDATVGAAPTLTVSAEEELPDACGACVTLTAHASGGVAPYTYRWIPKASGDGGVAEVCPAVATIYTVTATDSSGRPGGEFPATGATASATIAVGATRACGVTAAPGDAGDAASLVYWADWQSVDGGTVSGVLSPPSGAIQVVYSGNLFGAQTTSGANQFTPSSTFTSATVANAPPGPGMIEVSGVTTETDTLAFSEPVKNPVLAIYALGTGYAGESASILFSVPFTVLSSGLATNGSTIFGNELLVPVDGGVSGVGGNGVVELEGTFSMIQWTNPNDTPYASYTGLTVGIRAQP
jgi:hypothetical protein